MNLFNLLVSVFTAVTFLNRAEAVDFEKTLLKDLDHKAIVTVLSTFAPESSSNYLWIRSPGKPEVCVGFVSKSTVLAPRDQSNVDRDIERTKTSSSAYLVLYFDPQKSGLEYLAIARPVGDTMTVGHFNQLMHGKFAISNGATLSDESEGVAFFKLELPAKIKFEEDFRLGPQESKLVFTHPKKQNVSIIIYFKEKISRTRVISKGTVFEIPKLEYSDSSNQHTTKLLLNSKDIESIVCLGGTSTAFSTTDFYEIMGNRASITQNTEPPVPVQ